MATKNNEIQFLLTLNVDDIDKFNSDIKNIKYAIIKATNNIINLNNIKCSVKIDNINNENNR